MTPTFRGRLREPDACFARWVPVWHFVGPGRHGVDFLMLGPGAERLSAIEIKGTLCPGRWPRLRQAELTQLDAAWLDKLDNPAMKEWGMQADDVYAAVAAVNFHELAYKVALTAGYVRWHPVVGVAQLDELEWLAE